MTARWGSLPAALRWFAAGLSALILLVATRWPLAPVHLYFFDNVNFALALDDFNPAMHQPQPPGYPLFVGLTRLIHIFVPDPPHVFLIAGFIGALAALFLIRCLGASMFAPAAGWIAAALLFANPPFWLAGIASQVRIFLAVGSLGTGLLAWHALQKDAPSGWFYGSFAWLGIAAGFRPVESMLLVPLLLWVWAHSSRSLRRLALAILIFSATLAPSLIVTVTAMGGVHATTGILWSYANAQFQGSSRLFGAADNAALTMLAEAVVWNGLGMLAWIWALPFSAVRRAFGSWDIRMRFLLFWFLPPFLFSALIHIGDPDQALTTIPILCLCGGAVLESLVRSPGGWRIGGMAAGAAAISSLLFFVPLPLKIARATTYRAVAGGARITDAAIYAIENIRKRGPAIIIHYGFPVSWRQISYYFPDDYVVFLPGVPGDSAPSGDAWILQHRKLLSAYRSGSSIILPPGRQLVFLLPQGVRPMQVATDLPASKQLGRVFYLCGLPRKQFRFGWYDFAFSGNTSVAIRAQAPRLVP